MRGLTPVWKKVLLWVKGYPTASHATDTSLGKEESVDAATFIIVSFKEIARATLTFSNHHTDHSAAINSEARLSSNNKDSLKT